MKKCLNVKIITYLHYSETRLRTNHFSLTQTKTDTFCTCVNSVDPDEMVRNIWFYSVCHSIFNFRPKPLFASVDVSKIKDKKFHVRNSGVKGLNSSLYVYFQGSLISGSMSEILPILAFGITSVIAGFLALLLPETRNRYMPENIHDMKHLA